MKFLVTGATGFIGKALVTELLENSSEVVIVVREKSNLFRGQVKQFVVGDFGNNPDFSASLLGVDCVIHLAAKAHVIDKAEIAVLDEYREINRILTLNLAKQSALAGVRRFIFLSSIRVNGNENSRPFLESDAANPQEPYAVSKYEAEQGLMNLSGSFKLGIVIIRPPLVYGPGAPGNFGRLLGWAGARFMVPLPFGSVNNARSLLAIDNLVSFIRCCAVHEKAKNETFLISDRCPISTTELLKEIAKSFNRKALLFSIPVNWMVFMARLLGKEADSVRLFSSLTVDIAKARELLGWIPTTTMSEQLAKMVDNEKNI